MSTGLRYLCFILAGVLIFTGIGQMLLFHNFVHGAVDGFTAGVLIALGWKEEDEQ